MREYVVEIDGSDLIRAYRAAACLGDVRNLPKIVLFAREKTFPGTQRRLAAFKFVW
jgi:hypothetical protein